MKTIVPKIFPVDGHFKGQRTAVELFTYEGAGHGFLAYTRPTYNAEAAKLAWRRAVQFLHKYLGS